MGIIVITIFIVSTLITGIIGGKYLYYLIKKTKMNRFEVLVFKICGFNNETMGAKRYFLNLVIFNVAISIFAIFLIYIGQFSNFFNPNNTTTLSFGEIINTVISYITNTNLTIVDATTKYSYFIKTFVIVPLMFISAATAIAACFAFLRGITNNLVDKKLGNFYMDFIRVLFYFLIPLSIIGALLLMLSGVVQNIEGDIVYNNVANTTNVINNGLIASFESIKLIGTNGGSYVTNNSISPAENPNLISNILQIMFMSITSVSLIFAFGYLIKNKKQALMLYIAVMVIFVIGFFLLTYSLMQVPINEVDMYPYFNALFLNSTTAFSAGAINTIISSVGPIGLFVLMFNMLTAVVFGGAGTGFMSLIMYVLLTIFLVGLMVGHSPEFDEKKIELHEVKYLAIAIFLQPIIILLAIALTTIVVGSITSGELSTFMYNITSSTVNNGSAMTDNLNTPYWNILTTILMLIGRYAPIILYLLVAYSLGTKHKTLEGKSAFRTDNIIFVILLIIIIIIISLLTFIPLLLIGPLSSLF